MNEDSAQELVGLAASARDTIRKLRAEDEFRQRIEAAVAVFYEAARPYLDELHENASMDHPGAAAIVTLLDAYENVQIDRARAGLEATKTHP